LAIGGDVGAITGAFRRNRTTRDKTLSLKGLDRFALASAPCFAALFRVLSHVIYVLIPPRRSTDLVAISERLHIKLPIGSYS
jgi:hypothetical protein